MLEGFVPKDVQTQDTTIHLAQGGRGDPVLLLHGYPQTHVCWHLVAPRLAERFTVVAPDLRGCGDSGKPISDAEHRAYSKRVMARDQVEMMAQLGFERFAVVGHDRGARVAHRMALDHPERVTKLALLDIIPTRTAFENVDKDMATGAFNWFFSVQGGGLPERLIGAEAEFYLRWILEDWRGDARALEPQAIAEYLRCFTPETIRATCEEFRAAASIDLIDDVADENQKIGCPTLVLWSAESWTTFDMLQVWREKADGVEGKAFGCGHFLPEEAAEETATELLRFLTS